ncbi:MAG: hypothetical protein QXE51_00045 [Nitrososphaeria archaeon]
MLYLYETHSHKKYLVVREVYPKSSEWLDIYDSVKSETQDLVRELQEVTPKESSISWVKEFLERSSDFFLIEDEDLIYANKPLYPNVESGFFVVVYPDRTYACLAVSVSKKEKASVIYELTNRFLVQKQTTERVFESVISEIKSKVRESKESENILDMFGFDKDTKQGD